MEPGNKNVERGAATRHHIIEVATKLFASQGYAATPIEKILESSGLSRGAFYHHFKSKEQIFEAVFMVVEKEFTSRTLEQIRHIADPMEQLRAGCYFMVEGASESRLRQIGLIDAPVVLGWERWRRIEDEFGLGLLRSGLNAAAAARGHSGELPPERARLLLAALIEAALLVARADDRAQSLSHCRSAVDKLLLALVD